MITTWLYFYAGPWLAKRARETYGKHFLYALSCWEMRALCKHCPVQAPSDVEAVLACLCKKYIVYKLTGVVPELWGCLPPGAKELAAENSKKRRYVIGLEI